MRWLADFGVASPAFNRLRERLQAPQGAAMKDQPSVVKAEANFATLREELYMTDRQVRSAPACACRAPRVFQAVSTHCEPSGSSDSGMKTAAASGNVRPMHWHARPRAWPAHLSTIVS